MSLHRTSHIDQDQDKSIQGLYLISSLYERCIVFVLISKPSTLVIRGEMLTTILLLQKLYTQSTKSSTHIVNMDSKEALKRGLFVSTPSNIS